MGRGGGFKAQGVSSGSLLALTYVKMPYLWRAARGPWRGLFGSGRWNWSPLPLTSPPFIPLPYPPLRRVRLAIPWDLLGAGP